MTNIFANERIIKLRDNKARLDKKGYDYTYEEIQHEAHLGWLIKPGYVIIDFDNSIHAEVMENIVENLNLKTIRVNTTRGKHFIFKLSDSEFTDWTHKYNYIGLECDAKGNGTTQQKSNYECIKLNGILREQKCYGGINTLEEVQFLPKWLYCNKNGQNLRLSEGDGRNTTLFSYQINLINNKFTVDEAKYITKEIINKYVLIDKMTDVEIDTICRDEAYEKISKKDSKKLDLDNLLNDIKKSENIMVFNDRLVWYIDNSYTMDEDLMHNKIIEITFGHNTLESTRKEIMLRLRRTVDKCQVNNQYIILDNDNLYNLFTGDVIDNSVDIKAVFRYNYCYDTKANGGNVEEFINFLATERNGTFHEDTKQQLFEMIGCAIAPNTNFQKAFFLKGDGANGKSVLLRIIQKILGTHCTNVSLKEFSNPFSLEFLMRGTCNIIDDLGNQPLEDTDVFKQIVGGGEISVQAKNCSPYITRSLSTLIIAGNDYPKLGENSEAIERRLVFIELNNRVTKMNLNLVNELCDNDEGMTWLFTQSLLAYKNAMERSKLTVTENYKNTMASYKILSDHVLEFLIRMYMPKDKIIYNDDNEIISENYEDIDINNKSFNELYAIYKIWCADNGIKYPVSTIRFSKTIKKYLDDYYNTIHSHVDGIQGRYYQRKETL